MRTFSSSLTFFALLTLTATSYATDSNNAIDCTGTYYVSPSGNDGNNGQTLATPFRTVQKCASVVKAGESCVIRAGFYNEKVKPAFSGTATSPIVYKPYCNEFPVISGADILNSPQWVSVAKGAYKTSNLTLLPSQDPTGLTANQVFIIDQSQPKMSVVALQEARWPYTPYTTSPLRYPRSTATSAVNVSKTTAGEVWTLGDPGLTFAANALIGGRINFTGARAYNTLVGVITANDPVKKTLTFSMETNTGTSNNPVVGTRYTLSGPLAFINNVGQWGYDSTNKILYVVTPKGDSPANYTFAVKQRDIVFDFTDLSNITVQGLQIFAGRITTNSNPDKTVLTSKSNNIVLDGITGNYMTHFTYLGNAAFTYASRHGGIDFFGTNHILRNSIIDMGAGMLVSLFNSGHTVFNNLLTNGNYSGLVGGSVRPEGANMKIQNNTIRGTGVNGIIAKGTGDNKVTPGSNANTLVEYNDISAYGYVARDLGGIYSCCGHSGDFTGSVLRYNWFHDSVDIFINSADQTLARSQKGIYFDAGADNWTVHHNVVWNVNSGIAYNPENVTGFPQPQNNKFYNNIVWSVLNSANSGTPPAGQTINATFTNNIFSVTPTATGTANGINFQPPQNPNFVSGVSPFNFNLTKGSAAINTAVIIPGITDGYVGVAPDFGAYEYGLPYWTAGCNLSTACH